MRAQNLEHENVLEDLVSTLSDSKQDPTRKYSLEKLRVSSAGGT
jgi:hypothetical protein